MAVAKETAALCRSLRGEYPTLAQERIWGEWWKWATKSVKPSAGLTFLYSTGWIWLYPELAALVGLEQESDWSLLMDKLSASKRRMFEKWGVTPLAYVV
jgi:tRNA nucleotidyltransferase (CCA-adding enzyme)